MYVILTTLVLQCHYMYMHMMYTSTSISCTQNNRDSYMVHVHTSFLWWWGVLTLPSRGQSALLRCLCWWSILHGWQECCMYIHTYNMRDCYYCEWHGLRAAQIVSFCLPWSLHPLTMSTMHNIMNHMLAAHAQSASCVGKDRQSCMMLGMCSVHVCALLSSSYCRD